MNVAPRAAEDRTASGTPAERAEFEALLDQLAATNFEFEGSTDAVERFFELAREGPYLEERIADAEEHVEGEPGDLDGRIQLADLYVAKLLTVPGGPEQGLWGVRAEEQWKEVIARDDGHWGAHFALGRSYTYYPDFLDKTGDAIEQLERARTIQETGAALDDHAETYLLLSRMHLRRGRTDEARDVLRDGLGFHPGNEPIAAALEDLDR